MTENSQTVRLATDADVPELARLFEAEAEHEADRSQGAAALDPEVDWQAFATDALNRAHAAIFVLDEPGGTGSLQGLLYIRRILHRSGGARSAMRRLARRILRAGSGGIHSGYADYALVENVYVIPEARRSKVGLRLYQEAARWAVEHEIFELRGMVWDDNAPAVEFWKALDFKPLRTLFQKKLDR